jgi:hypothetical protein
MENVNESHDKPATPSTNVETPIAFFANKIGFHKKIKKKKIESYESVNCMVALYKSGTS